MSSNRFVCPYRHVPCNSYTTVCELLRNENERLKNETTRLQQQVRSLGDQAEMYKQTNIANEQMVLQLRVSYSSTFKNSSHHRQS